MIRKAITAKTRCVFIAHTLGNPFNLDAVVKVGEEHGLWVIEDNCDAFGSDLQGKIDWYIRTFIDDFVLSGPSHYYGRGGVVCTNDSSNWRKE